MFTQIRIRLKFARIKELSIKVEMVRLFVTYSASSPVLSQSLNANLYKNDYFLGWEKALNTVFGESSMIRKRLIELSQQKSM